MDTLKPCPFCGSEAKYERYKEDGCTILSIGCTKGYCWCHYKRNLWLETKEYYIQYELQKMIEEWNHRQVEE